MALSWEKVEKYLSEKTESGNIRALIETEKIFQKVLEKLNFPGKNIEKKVLGLKYILSDFDKFLIARKVYRKIVSDLDFEITAKEVEEVLTLYYKTIEEIINFQKKEKNFPTNLKIKFTAYFPRPKDFLKKAIASLVIFFFIIFLLDSTKLGRGLVSLFVKISHFIFSWVLFAILLLIGIAIIVVGSLFYFESRKKTKIKKIES